MVWSDKNLVDGPLPLWFQIVDRLLDDLNDGKFVPGDLMPSESQLISRFAVSRTTARTALDHLANRGLIVRRPGIGSVVREAPVEETPNILSSFKEEMKRHGLVAGFTAATIQVEPATALVSKRLALENGTPVCRLEYVLLADDEPIATHRAWFSPRALPVGSQPDPGELLENSVYEWIEANSGLRVAYAEEALEAGIADKQLATQLQAVLGSAVLTTRRTAFTSSNEGVEYSIRQYRGDRYRYRIKLTTS